jgi:hypothetical protein
MDSGATVPGQGRIDPWSGVRGSADLALASRRAGHRAGCSGVRVAVQVAAVGDSPASRSRGALRRERQRRTRLVAGDLDRQPFAERHARSRDDDSVAATAPVRMRVVARAVGTSGQRFSASAIVRLP